MKNKKPLTPKQRERLAREARQKNAAKTSVVVKKAPVPRETKWFFALLAMVLVFATLASVLFGFLLVDWTKNPYATVYEDLRMKDYLDTSSMGKSFYSGLDVNVTDLYRGEATDEEFAEEINDLLLSHRTMSEEGLGQKNSTIDYGDDVAYFIIGVKDKNGKAVLTNDFAASRYTASTLTVGGRTFGANFDEVLAGLGLTPADTAMETDTNGILTGNEVVVITLYAYKGTKIKDANNADETKNYTWEASAAETRQTARLELSSLSAPLREKLTGAMVGEDLTFVLKDYKLSANDDAKASDAVKFEVRVHAVVTVEKAQEVTFVLPEDYFSADDGQDFTVLNGQTLTFSMIFSSVNNYDVPELDADFVTNTMKFETEEEDVVAAFKDAKRAELNARIRENLELRYVDKILRLLGSRAKFITVNMPTAAINEQYTLLEEEYRQTFGTAPEGEEWLDAYAQQYYGVSDYYEVLTARVKAKLVVFYIFRHADLKISDEEMERAYRDYVDGLIASAGGAELYDEDHFVRLYTKEELYRRARTELVQEMVGDYLLSHNNLIEKAE